MPPVDCANRQAFVDALNTLLASPASDTDEFAIRADQIITGNHQKWGILGTTLRQKIGMIGEKISQGKAKQPMTSRLEFLE